MYLPSTFCGVGGGFKLFPLPFPIYDLVHMQQSDHFDTDEQLFTRTAFTL